jgi:hypothetical protein
MYVLLELSHFFLSNVSFFMSLRAVSSHGMCLWMQAFYAVHRIKACRDLGHNKRQASNLNNFSLSVHELNVVKYTEWSQTLLPRALYLHSYIDSIFWHVNHSPWQNIIPSCLQDTKLRISSYTYSSSWIETQRGERWAKTRVIWDEILKWGNLTWELHCNIEVCE